MTNNRHNFKTDQKKTIVSLFLVCIQLRVCRKLDGQQYNNDEAFIIDEYYVNFYIATT